MEDIAFNLLSGLTFIIPELFILGAGIYYLTRKVTIDGILIVLGSVIILLAGTFNIVIMPYLMSQQGIGSSWIYSITGAISFIGAICFAVGLLLLIMRVTKMMDAEN